jgi:hypothetical protein
MTYFSLYYLWSTLGYNTIEYPTIDKQEEEVTCTTEPPELHIFVGEIESSEDDDDSEPLKKKSRSRRKRKRH